MHLCMSSDGLLRLASCTVVRVLIVQEEQRQQLLQDLELKTCRGGGVGVGEYTQLQFRRYGAVAYLLSPSLCPG